MADKKAVARESRYPKSMLIENAQAIFRVKPEVVIGALHDNIKEELTKTEVKEAINKFLNKKLVKGGNR